MPTKSEPAFDMDLDKELFDQVRALIGGNQPMTRTNIRKARRLMRKWPSWMAESIDVWNTLIAKRRHRGEIVD